VQSAGAANTLHAGPEKTVGEKTVHMKDFPLLVKKEKNDQGYQEDL